MKRPFALLLTVCVFLTLTPHACAAPNTSAESAILIDAADGEILYEKNTDTPLPMASTTKIMTALIVLENADLSQMVTVPKEAVGVEGSSAYLYAGERILLRDLVFALLLQSANDAAEALAILTEKSVDAFVSKMNEKADRLGMTNTHFSNPHGLPAEGHHSTANDMAKLMQAALDNPEFLAISGAKNHTTASTKGGTQHYFRNHNRLLTDYDSCIAGKTGYTKVAGRCLVTAAEQNGARLVCVTLSAPDDWNDHKTLFEYGFSLYQEHLLYHAGELSLTLPVVGGTATAVKAQSIQEVRATLRTKESVAVHYEAAHFVYAPVFGLDRLPENAPSPPDGMCAGVAVISQGDHELFRIKLYYTNSVDEYIPPTLWERILQFFGWKKSESKNS